VLTPLEFDARKLVHAAAANVLRANFTAGANPSFFHFSHRAHPGAPPVSSLVTCHPDHRVLPTFHSGVGEKEWRAHVMPFYHQYWRSWLHSSVSPYPLKSSVVTTLQKAAQEAGRKLASDLRSHSAASRQLHWWNTGASDAEDFGVESTAEEIGESVSEGSGTIVGVAAGAVLDRKEWAEHPAEEAVKTGAEVGAEVSGGVMGEAGGSMAGAAIGAAVGGPVGAVVGEEVGGVIGERVGQFAGGEVAKHAQDLYKASSHVSNFFHHFG